MVAYWPGKRRPPLKSFPFNLIGLIDSILAQFTVLTKPKNLNFVKEVPSKDRPYFYMVFGDEQKISDILRHFVGQCIDFANTGSDILISLAVQQY